jgi:hypothetical protein
MLQSLTIEAEQNKQLAVETTLTIIKDYVNLKSGIESPLNLMREFSTTALSNANSSGVTPCFSESLQRSLSIHYREIEMTNKAISQRLSLRAGSQGLSGYGELATQNDLQAIGTLLKIYPRDELFDALRGHVKEITDGEMSGDELVGLLDDLVEQERDELSDNVFEELEMGTFETLDEELESEIDDHWLMAKLLRLR